MPVLELNRPKLRCDHRIGGRTIELIRAEFPILSRQVYGKPLIYFDSANTSQKPQCVIDAIDRYYREYNANIHRATHRMSEEATAAYEGTRKTMARFINAARTEEIVFVKGCTDAINLVASSWGRNNLRAGDEILISWMEHHSNIVPWQLICEATGAILRVIPITEVGTLDMDSFDTLLTEKTKLVSVVHVSNSLGTVNPVKEIIERAHSFGAVVMVDGAQAVPHMAVDVRDLECDFYAFSSHKMFGPTGTGVLYGKYELLNAMPPYQGGGDMISDVTFAKTTYNSVPYKFEAGTPNIADVIGMGVAADYLVGLGLEAVAEYEHHLLEYGTEVLADVPGVSLVGTAPNKASVLSFVMDGVHPHDVGTFLDREGIAVRTGQHCCQPVMDRFGISATTRASLAFYNTMDEMDQLAASLRKVMEIFG